MAITVTSVDPPRIADRAQLKQFDTQVAVTGTATVAFAPPANKIIAGTEHVTIANMAVTVTTALAGESGLSGTSISVVVVALAAAANTISAVAQNVNISCKGW